MYGLIRYAFQVVDAMGAAITSGLTVTIRTPAGATATIYADEMKSAKVNPITSTVFNGLGNGVVVFWSGATSFDIEISDADNNYQYIYDWTFDQARIAFTGYKRDSDPKTLDNVTDGATYLKLAGVNGSHLATASSLAADAVETAKIKDGNVTVAKLGTDAVETAKIKDGNVTAVKLAADAVETAKIKDLNVTAGKLANAVADQIVGGTLTVSAEAANVVTLTFQAKDAEGNNLAAVTPVELWLADAADGALVATAPDGGVAATTGTVIAVLTAGKHLLCVTDASGVLVLTATESGAKTAYAQARLGAARIAGSIALTWAGA